MSTMFQSVARLRLRATGRAPGGVPPFAFRRCHLSRTSGHPAGRLPGSLVTGDSSQQVSFLTFLCFSSQLGRASRLFCRFSKSRDHSHCPKPYRLHVASGGAG